MCTLIPSVDIVLSWDHNALLDWSSFPCDNHLAYKRKNAHEWKGCNVFMLARLVLMEGHRVHMELFFYAKNFFF